MPADRREPKGSMSDAKRARIRKALERTWDGARRHAVKLNADAVRKLEAIEHVAARRCRSSSSAARRSWTASPRMSPASRSRRRLASSRDRLIAGRMLRTRRRPGGDRPRIPALPMGPGERCGCRFGAGADLPAGVPPAVARHLRPVLAAQRGEAGSSATKRTRGAGIGPEDDWRPWSGSCRSPPDERDVLRELFEHVSETSTKTRRRPIAEEFTIVGVLREHDEKDEKPGDLRGGLPHRDADVLLPSRRGGRIRPSHSRVRPRRGSTPRDRHGRPRGGREGRRPADREDGVHGQCSLAEFIDTVRMNVLLVSIATAFVAIVALVVAAIGITNTMIMSVLERTHEIGIMKALGARDRHIRLIFVVEGVLIGLVGSGLGTGAGMAGVVPGRLRSPRASWSRRRASPVEGFAVRLPALAGRGRAGPGLPDHDPGGVVSGLASGAGRPGDLAAA